MSACLSARGLRVIRGERELVRTLDFALHAGRICVVLGPNGAGKSSLLAALAGLIPCQGEVSINRQALCGYSRAGLAGQVAWQGELPLTEFGLTVRQRLSLARPGQGGDFTGVAKEMDIATLMERPLGELSAGERQRTELAALMLRDVPVWLLDEPTAHLDLRHQVQCIRMLRAQRRKGRAMLVVLHDLAQAEAIADHAILVDGRGQAAYREAGLPDIDTLGRLYGTALQKNRAIGPDYGDMA